MKNIKRYFATLMLLVGFTIPAQAALITQDILLDDGVIGGITINTSSGSNDGSGFLDFDSFEEFTLFGRDMGFAVFDFMAIVDGADLFAGIEFLAFDTESADSFAFQGIYDAFAADPALDNFLDVFDPLATPPSPVAFGELSLGQATVVSEPGMAIVFLTAMLIALPRRKKYFK